MKRVSFKGTILLSLILHISTSAFIDRPSINNNNKIKRPNNIASNLKVPFWHLSHIDGTRGGLFSSSLSSRTTKAINSKQTIIIPYEEENEDSSCWNVKNATFLLNPTPFFSSSSSSSSSSWRNKLFFFRNRNPQQNEQKQSLRFSYQYNEFYSQRHQQQDDDDDDDDDEPIKAVVLIPPIGVGIAKWFFHRLIQSIFSIYHPEKEENNNKNNNSQTTNKPNKLLVISPDLLGCGSASSPFSNNGNNRISKLPLLNISNWGDQLIDLMIQCEKDWNSTINKNHNNNNNIQWTVAANGGCAPIALYVAARFADRLKQTKIQKQQQQQKINVSSLSTSSNAPSNAPFFQGNVTNVVLSSVPALPFFFLRSNPSRVDRSYRILSSFFVGRFFWWYSLRNHGSFIQRFSERNLVSNVKNLGPEWTPNCVLTAKSYGGRSRYSTFAFLAGALQDGCIHDLEVSLRDSRSSDDGVAIHFIKGGDLRPNKARSWFWQKRRKQNPSSSTTTTNASSSNVNMTNTTSYKTLRDYILENDMGGKEEIIGGRRSVAYEDPMGYATALLKFMSESNVK